MNLRAALAAVFFSVLPGLSAAAEPAAAASEQPAALNRAADSHATVQSLRSMLKALPASTVRNQILPVLERIDGGAAALPKDQREAFVRRSLPELTSLAAGLTLDSTPKAVLKQIQNAAAYMNNRANRWEDSRRLAESVLAYDPKNCDALINRSNANYGLQNFQSAYADADLAAHLDPDNPDAYTARALATYRMGQYLDALEDARRALALNANDRTAYALMRLAEGRVPPVTIRDVKTRLEVEVQREYHGMVTQINQVENKSQEVPPAPQAPAVEHLLRSAADKIALKDYFGAIAAADKALAADPNNTSAFYYRAAAYNLIGQYDSAISNASQALSLNPTETAARDARSFAYNRLGRFNDALADANHSLEINPKNPYAFANRGFAHEKMGDLESMLTDLKKAAELNPQFEPVYHDAAAAYGIELSPAASQAAASGAQAPQAPQPSRRRQFLFILASSLAGGLLIAAGFMHLFSERWSRPAGPVAAPLGAGAPAGSKPKAGFSITDAYVMGQTLGQGGMGVVYEAMDKALGRKVAIKMLLDDYTVDPKAKAQFLEEARTVAALHHPNIVDIHSVLSDDYGLYLVFEFIAGRTLDELISEKGRLPLAEAKAIMRPVCAALEFAHQRHVVHRDLKPANIMITEQGVVKVMDFGISRRVRDSQPAPAGGPRGYDVTNSVTGTPYYMAPEQEYGMVRPESDIYSLGTCLYEMVTGRRPYAPPASQAEKLACRYPKPSVLEASLPRSFDMLIDGALHPDPEKRIRGAADFWNRLDAVRESESDIGPS